MTREQFDDLVRRVEQKHGSDPKALRWRVGLLAAIGYAGLLTWMFAVWVLAALFFLLAGFVEGGGKISCLIFGSIILLLGTWAVLRVLLVRLPPPEGRALQRQEAPALFQVVDDLRGRLRAPPFHRVLVLPDCNAAVAQVPRLGAMGWSRNYLLLGLPLLDGLPPDEFKAVLAHELAHLSREHGRFGRWIYRLRRSWAQVFEQLSRPRVQGEISLRPLIVKFIDWFWPRFNAYAFVLSRTDEYEADAMAGRVAGAEALGSSLIRIALADRQLDDKFWPEVWETANLEAAPPNGVFARVSACLRAGPPEADGKKWLDQAFSFSTTNADTHPCLTDRLRALNFAREKNAALLPLAVSATEALLGKAQEAIRQGVEDHWRKKVEPVWRERHAKAASLQHRLNRLEEFRPDQAGDVDSLWDKARMLMDLKGNEAVEPLLRQILAQQPNHVPANFELGRLLLDKSQEEGVACLERAMGEDEDLVPPGCELLHHYYRRLGQTQALRELDARMDRYERELEISRMERSSVTANDRFIEHDLSEAELQALRQMLQAQPEVLEAELGRKELKHFPKQKLFLLCVRARAGWLGFAKEEAEQELVNKLSQSVRLPGRVLVFAARGQFRPLARKLRQVRNAGVFRRNKNDE